MNSRFSFLKDLLQTPSPPGSEREIQDVVRAWAGPLAQDVRTDLHGNVLAVVNPEGSPRIMLAGHCDQISLMVQHIDDNGFLYVQPMGGWDMQILLGQNLVVWTRQGGISGVVSRKAPHLLTSEERNKVPQFTDIWVDIGAKDKKEAEELVTPGDPVTVDLVHRPLRNGLFTSPAMDDKVGVWTVLETLRLLHGQAAARPRSIASRRCRKRSACAGPRPAPTASTRPSASPSTSAMPPTRRATTRSSSATPGSATAR